MKYVYILEDCNGQPEQIFSSLKKVINTCFTESKLWIVECDGRAGPDEAKKLILRDGYCLFDGHEFNAIQRMPLQ